MACAVAQPVIGCTACAYGVHRNSVASDGSVGLALVSARDITDRMVAAGVGGAG